MKLIESARMEGIVDISIKSKESSVVNGIKSISNGGSATAEEDLIGGPDADETTDLNDQEIGQQEIDDLLASDEENSQEGKATKNSAETATKAPKSDSASSEGKDSSKDASGENSLSNGHSNGTDEKSSEKSSEEKDKESEGDKDKNGPSEEKSPNGSTESSEVEKGQADENNKSESQKPDEETPKEEDPDDKKPAAKDLEKKSAAESSQKSYQSITDLAEAETSDEDEEMEEDTTSPKATAAKGASSSDERGGGPKPFEPKVEVKSEEKEATPDSPMETSPSDIKAKKEEEDSGSDEEKEDKKSSGKEETKEASGGVTAALVPVTADDDTEDEEEEDEDETNKPKENNKETTKAQEEKEANQDATNKEKPQSPKPKEKPDYGKALTKIVAIAQGVRALDQDDDSTETSSGRKRASSSEEPSSKTSSATGGPSSSSEAKKARTSAAATADNASKEEAVKKSLRKISRKELESIAAKRVVESLASRSELGQIRTRLQDLEDSRNKWMKKAQARGKMLQDLCTVVKRYIQDVESEKEGAKPIIITRSVGLQVVDAAAAKKVLVPATAAAAQMRKPVGMTNGPRGPPHLQGGDRQSPQQQRALPVTSNAQFRANHEVSVHRVPAGSAAGGRKVVSPAMVPQQALKRPLAVAPGASPPNLAKRPAMVANMVTPPGVTISPIAAQHARPQQQNINIPVAIPPQVSISRTAAPVTAAVAVRPAAGIQLPKQPVATAQTANKPQPSKNPNSVIDVVDLSDDEDSSGKPAPAARPPPQPQQPVTTVAYTYGPPPASVAAANGQRIILAPGTAATPVRGVQPGSCLIPVTGGGATRQVVMQPQAAPPQPLTLQRALTHPAPPPEQPSTQQPFVQGKRAPAQPVLKINSTNGGIVLSWDIKGSTLEVSPTKWYQIFAYQENSNQAVASTLWKKVGDVKALPLPMACTLTQFSRGNRYHFAVRAKDQFDRVSVFSDPQSISLN